MRTRLGRRGKAGADFLHDRSFFPEELTEKLAELQGFPLIKIKSDEAASLETTRFIRDRSHATLAIDANCAWSSVDLHALAADCARLGIAFIEQPLPPAHDALLPRRPAGLPIFADESCVVEGDVPRVAGYFDGFNIKLVKCGGLTPALRMVRLGRSLGRQTMVGCMLESSVLIAAGAVIGQGTDYADLDGAWLLGNDPAEGWTFDRGTLRPPQGSGLGARLPGGFFGNP